MKNAIILAAGIGSRLRPLTEKSPKCCVPVGGQSLLKRIIGQILATESDFGIYVAAGYLVGSVREEVMGFGSKVTVVENVDFSTTNNMESCRRVLEQMAIDDTVLILNGDCIYADAIVERMVHARYDSIGVDSGRYSDESMKVRIRNGRIVDIAKTLPEGSNCVTSIDFYRFGARSAQLLFEIMQRYRAKDDLNQWTEVAIQDLLRKENVAIGPIDIKGHSWVEIDNHLDLAEAERIWQ